MLHLLLTPRLASAVKEATRVLAMDVDFCLSLRHRLTTPADHGPDTTAPPRGIPIDLVEALSKRMLEWERGNGQVGDSPYYLHELVRGSSVFTPPKTVAPRSQELTDRLERIHAANANAAYARMVSYVTPQQNETLAEMRSTNNQVAAIFNVFFSVAAVATAVYWVSSTITSDIAIRVLLSLGGAMIILVAEVWFFVRYAGRRDNQVGADTEGSEALLSPSVRAFIR